MPPGPLRPRLALAFLALLPLAPSSAQYPAHGTVYERTGRARWMNERQSPAFSPWSDVRNVMRLDSLRTGPTEATAFLSTIGLASRLRARLSLTADGKVKQIEGSFDPVPPRMNFNPDTTSFERFRTGYAEFTSLPAAIAWDMIPTFHPGRLAAGQSWRDTVDWRDEHAGVRQALRGARISRLVRDSVASGRQLWLVRDSLVGEWSEQRPEYDPSFRADVTTSRTARGQVVGQYWLDAVSHTLIRRDDTLSFSGMVTSQLPDGRSFHARTKFEQQRHLEAFDSLTYISTLAARRAAAPRFSIFRFPTGDVAESIAAGNVGTRDSVWRLYRSARDIDARSALGALLGNWRPKNRQAWQDSLREARLQDGDTTGVISGLIDQGTTQLTPDRLKLILPLARDPALALAYGVPINELYLFSEQRLAEHPPATTTDTSRWPCSPKACEQLAAMRTTEKEPRLRRLGLAVAFALDPKRWVADVRNEPNFTQLHLLADGVGATSLVSSHPRLPGVGASWQQWAEWMTGKRVDIDSTARAPGTPPTLRIGDSHTNALAVQQLITGRDFTAEWQSAEGKAGDGVEHLVFETLLAQRHAWQPDADSLAVWIQGESKVDRARGLLGADVVIREAPMATDSTLLTMLIDRVLAHAIDGEVPWPTITNDRGARPVGALLDNATNPGRGLAGQAPQTIYVKTPVVTGALRAKWGNRVVWITDLTWSPTKEQYPATMITITGLSSKGAFASVGADLFSASKDSRGVNAGAGGNSYQLLLTKDGWKIINSLTWAA